MKGLPQLITFDHTDSSSFSLFVFPVELEIHLLKTDWSFWVCTQHALSIKIDHLTIWRDVWSV